MYSTKKKTRSLGIGLNNTAQTFSCFYKLQHFFPHLFGTDDVFYIAN